MVCVETYPPDTDDFGFANVHALLFLLGGLDSHATNLARSLLLAKDDAVLTTLHSNCKVRVWITALELRRKGFDTALELQSKRVYHIAQVLFWLSKRNRIGPHTVTPDIARKGPAKGVHWERAHAFHDCHTLTFGAVQDH